MLDEAQKLKELISRLEFHFDKYLDCKHQSEKASRKPDREKAHKNMISVAGHIENLLLEWPCFGIIKNGNPYQFEDFWRYVGSDMPDYLSALKTHLKKLETTSSEE